MSSLSIPMSPEEVYTDASDESQQVQERQRVEQIDPMAILQILADDLLGNPSNAIHAWVVQTITLADMRPYMSQAEGHTIGDEIARLAVKAMVDQVTMAHAVEG
jgi:hypothetical protein